MGNFGLLVRFTLRDGMGDAFDQLVKETETGIREREPGTLVYACHHVKDAPNERVFFEIYEDRAAFDAHEQEQHTLRFLRERTQYIEKTEVDWLTSFAGKYPQGGPE
ncbi:antibiotic biosynthesis monooxygenase [Streptomyces sp. NPDC008150]|uniref:putative quinol monooxygenase n=1 Tax=Streptomyces sp. NPDC008150 TaxID=3364816 RepID=UPI0036E18278